MRKVQKPYILRSNLRSNLFQKVNNTIFVRDIAYRSKVASSLYFTQRVWFESFWSNVLSITGCFSVAMHILFPSLQFKLLKPTYTSQTPLFYNTVLYQIQPLLCFVQAHGVNNVVIETEQENFYGIHPIIYSDSFHELLLMERKPRRRITVTSSSNEIQRSVGR
jgi:hypothetical protein